MVVVAAEGIPQGIVTSHFHLQNPIRAEIVVQLLRQGVLWEQVAVLKMAAGEPETILHHFAVPFNHQEVYLCPYT